MNRLLRAGILYPLIVALSAVLAACAYLYFHAKASALSESETASLAEANPASSAMCVPGQNNDVFFVTCGGIY